MTFPIHSIKHVKASHRKYQIITIFLTIVTLTAALAAAFSSIQLSKLNMETKKVAEEATPPGTVPIIGETANKEIETLKSELAREKSISQKMKAKINDLNNQIASLKKAAMVSKSPKQEAPPAAQPKATAVPQPKPTPTPQQKEPMVQSPPPAPAPPPAKTETEPTSTPASGSNTAPQPETPAIKQPTKADTDTSTKPAPAPAPEMPAKEEVPPKVEPKKIPKPAPKVESEQPAATPPATSPADQSPSGTQPSTDQQPEENPGQSAPVTGNPKERSAVTTPLPSSAPSATPLDDNPRFADTSGKVALPSMEDNKETTGTGLPINNDKP